MKILLYGFISTLICFLMSSCVSGSNTVKDVLPASNSDSREGLEYKPAQDQIPRLRFDNEKENTGISERIQPFTGVELAQGFSRISGNTRGSALDRGINNRVITHENAIDYDLKLIDSYRELVKSLKLDIRASYKGLGGSASASLNLFKSAKYSSRKVYILVSMQIINGSEVLTNYNLSESALQSLENEGRNSSFTNKYGDTFINRIVRGAELYALLEFSVEGASTTESLRIAVKGGMGGFNADARLEQKINEITRNRNVRIYYSQSGGQTGAIPTSSNQSSKDFVSGGVLALTPEQLISRLREFPREVRSEEGFKNSAALWAEVKDYRVSENWPRNANIPTYLKELWDLEDLAAVKLLVDQENHDAEEILEDPRSYPKNETKIEASEISKYTEYISEQISRLGTQGLVDPTITQGFTTKKLLPSRQAYEKLKICYGDKECITDKPMCIAAHPDEEIVLKCLLHNYPVNYGVIPRKTVFSLDNLQEKTQSHWTKGGGGTVGTAWICNADLTNTELAKNGFEIVVVNGYKRSPNRNRSNVDCIPDTPVGFEQCNQGDEWCVEWFYKDACIVNSTWHNWYKSNTTANGTYDIAKVCED